MMYSGNYKQFDSKSLYQEIIMKRNAGIKAYWTFNARNFLSNMKTMERFGGFLSGESHSKRGKQFTIKLLRPGP